MLYSGTDPESYITEYTLVYEDYRLIACGHRKLTSVHFSRWANAPWGGVCQGKSEI